jgi:hypothetical protein
MATRQALFKNSLYLVHWPLIERTLRAPGFGAITSDNILHTGGGTATASERRRAKSAKRGSSALVPQAPTTAGWSEIQCHWSLVAGDRGPALIGFSTNTHCHYHALPRITTHCALRTATHYHPLPRPITSHSHYHYHPLPLPLPKTQALPITDYRIKY